MAYIKCEWNHLYEYDLHKTQTTHINGSRLGLRPDQSNVDIVGFGALCNLQQWLEWAKMRNDWLWSGKSPYFTLSFSFQINVSVKISAGLLRNLCRNLDEKLVSDQSIGLKEMFQCWMRSIVDKSSVSLVQQVIFASLQCTFQRLCFKKNCREPSVLNLWNPGGGGLGYNNWKQSMRSGHSQLQQTTNNVWVDLYKHLFVYGKPQLG